MASYTVGVDFGTLSARALLVNASTGEEIAEAAMDYPHGVMSERLARTGAPLPPNYALQDPADYLAALAYVVPAVLARGGVAPAEVVGLGIDFTCCTLLSVDGAGVPLCEKERFAETPLAYALLWKHHAATPYAHRLTALAQKRGEDFLARCGGKIDEEWALPKLWQVLCEAPEVCEAATHFVEAGDWIVWRLTGTLRRAYQFAAYKAHFETGKGYPSADFLAAADPRLADLAQKKLQGTLYPAAAKAGTLCAEMAETLGLCEGTAVAVAQPDGHCAALALGLRHPGDMLAVLGTSGCFMTVNDQRKDVPGICGRVRDGILPGLFGYEAGLCCLGDHFAYAAERLTSPAYVEEARERGCSMLQLLLEKAARKRPGESGVLALNWFNGNRSILVNGNLSGAFVGLTLCTAPEDLMRALVEAVCFGARNIVENFEANGVNIRRIVASGGIAHKSPFVMQTLADILGRELTVTQTAQAPALSSAIAAAVAAGTYPDLDTAIGAMRSPVLRTYTPNGENFEVYTALYHEYKTLHDYFGRGENPVMERLRALAEAQKGV